MSELEQFNTLRATIIKNVVKDIYKNHINEGIIKIKQQDLLNILLKIVKCKKCNKNCLANSYYCEKHYKNHFTDNYNTNTNNTNTNTDTTNTEIYQVLGDTDSDTEYITSLNKKLIDNTFYYIDEKYNCFYDSDCNQVGIIKDDQFIFTHNPFLFDTF